MHKLTSRQETVLAFIREYIHQYRRAPLIREIQAGCQITSYKSTVDRLNALERKRFIKRTPNQHRGVRLLRQSAKPETTPSAATPVVESAESVSAMERAR